MNLFCRKSILLLIFSVVIWAIITFWNFGLPGIQMDEANHSAFVPGILSQEAAELHHFRLPDNLIDIRDGKHRFPILGGSFYNVTFSAYAGVPFYQLFGFTLESLRIYHGLWGLLGVLLGAFLLKHFFGYIPAFLFPLIIFSNPDVVFSLRSQGFMFWPPLVFVLIAVHLFLYALNMLGSGNSLKKINLFYFFSGVCFGFALIAYFISYFIVLPILVICCYLLIKKTGFRTMISFFFGLLIGYAPFLYALLSVYLIAPHLLTSFGMPEFAQKSNILTFSKDNYLRIINLFWFGLGDFAFSKQVVGHYHSFLSSLRLAFLFIAVAMSAFFAWKGFKNKTGNGLLFLIILAVLLLYIFGMALLKAVSFHHLIPFIFIICLVVAAFTAVIGKAKWVAVIIVTVVMLTNTSSLYGAQRTLQITGGAGFHNEHYSSLAAVFATELEGYHPFFASWGFHLPYLFQTKGCKAYSFTSDFTEEAVEQYLHQHNKIAIVGLHSDNYRNLDQDLVKKKMEFNQRDGRYLFDIILLEKGGTHTDIKDYTFGENIYFQEGGNSGGFLGQGWSFGESGHHWTEGQFASITIPIEKTTSNLQLIMFLQPFVVSSIDHSQRVVLTVNGHELEEWKFTEEGQHKINVVIPNELIQSDVLYLTFDLPDAKSSVELGTSDDLRELGLAFWTLEVNEIDQVLP